MASDEEDRLIDYIKWELKRLLSWQWKDEYIDTINFIVSEGIQKWKTGKFQRVINYE